jgi:hypothetical protein
MRSVLKLAENEEMKSNSTSLFHYITPGALISFVLLAVSALGAWYDLSNKVALQGQRIDSSMVSTQVALLDHSQRIDRLSQAISQHEGLQGHPVEWERVQNDRGRVEGLEARVADLERARDRLKRSALEQRLNQAQQKVKVLQAKLAVVDRRVDHVEEKVEQPVVYRWIQAIFHP